MIPFTYVIAPEGCKPYLTPGKKYKIIKASESKHDFWAKDDTDYILYCLIAGCANLNGKDWIIPEIGQWPAGWTRHQKAMCLQNAGVGILTSGFMQIIGEGRGVTTSDSTSDSTNDYQGRTPKQLEGSYKIMAICFYALVAVIVVAAILKACS